jgi:hypothetical protein
VTLASLVEQGAQNAVVLKLREAFGLSPEPALMMLRGLQAEGVKDIERWLLLHGTTSSPKKMRDVVDTLMREGLIPARTITWKEFYDLVRYEAGGWLGDGRPAFGFNDKTIRRYVKNA